MKKLVLSLLLLLSFVSFSSAQTPSSDLEGKWSMKRKTDDGEVTQVLEFKKDAFTFRMLSKEGSLLFFAKGKIKAEKLGAFKAVTLSDIQWGGSESDLQSADDNRSYVYTIRYGELILASNFDKERDNEEPKSETYTKSK